MTFYGLPLPHTLFEISTGILPPAPAPVAVLPKGVKYEFHTLPVSITLHSSSNLSPFTDIYTVTNLSIITDYKYNQVDAKSVADGDTITVYVSTADPRESSCVPSEVLMAAIQRTEARAERNYPEADALHQKIIDSGYRLVIPLFHLILIKTNRFQLHEAKRS